MTVEAVQSACGKVRVALRICFRRAILDLTGANSVAAWEAHGWRICTPGRRLAVSGPCRARQDVICNLPK